MLDTPATLAPELVAEDASGVGMYVHVIRSGKNNQYTKRLLRVGRREGRRVLNTTLVNVTGWSAEQLSKLESALQMKRRCRGTILEEEADQWILAIVAEQGFASPSMSWQLGSALSGHRTGMPRPHR